jgi:D-aminopeptidase
MARPRARDFGVEFGRLQPGRLNAITDVNGVGVGHVTVIEGNDIRTGVTAIVPHKGDIFERKASAAVDVFNAYGKSTGLTQIMYEGVIETPIMLTETLNTWRVADAVLDYFPVGYDRKPGSLNPIVGETNGRFLTDNVNRRIGPKEVFTAIDKARGNVGLEVGEGCVGGGTPMTGYGLKGGIGTASRITNGITVGALVQLNCGEMKDLMITGVPVGKELQLAPPQPSPGNSIMMIIATDIKLDSRQLMKLAKRAILGLARTGSYGGNFSGDFTISFSTSEKTVEESFGSSLAGDGFLSPLYHATVEATEEAVINALFKAETMWGYEGHVRQALPLDQVREIFNNYGRKLP